MARVGDVLRPMMGVTSQVWSEARGIMGERRAVATLLALLDRSATVRSMGAYLRHLTRQADQGRFSCAAFLMRTPA